MTLPKKLQLSPVFVRSIQRSGLPWLILGVLLFLANLGYQGDLLIELSQEQHLWARGHDAGQAAVRGQKYTRYSFFYEYDFEVIYNDADLKVYHRPLRFSALQSHIDDELEPKVKYDPEEPTRFAVSWGIAQQRERLLAIALFGSFWALFALLLSWLGHQKLRPLRDARRALKEPAIQRFAILHHKKEKTTISYVYQVAAQKRQAEIFFDEKERGPLLVGAPQKLVSLSHREHPERHVILCEDLFPLVMSEEERAVLLEQVLLEEERGGAV